MSTIIDRIRQKIDSPFDAFLHQINKIFLGKTKANEIVFLRNGAKLKKMYLNNGEWDFKGIKLPFYKNDMSAGLMHLVYLDSLFVFCKHNDNYDYSLIDDLDEILPEGAYGYVNNEIDVTVKENDIVIDAGAWIGDFSAYASVKGAKVYAFEPSVENTKYLEKTRELNKNIEIVRKGLGDKVGFFHLANNKVNSLIYEITEKNDNSETIEVTTIDEFVDEYNINRVDFIKADIEGYERYMLAGAKETLKRFAPKLAICTYHLQDDPDVLSKIILEANPNYIIVQKRKKLYAMVKIN